MSSAWKIIISVAGVVLLGLAGYWLYIHYRDIKGPHSSALDAIGPDVVFFARSDDIRATLYKLTNETDFWPDLTGDSLLYRFQTRFHSLDSAVATSGWLNEVVELQTFTVALDRIQEGGYGFVFMLELPPGDFTASFEDFVRRASGEQSIVLRKDFEKAEILTVNLAGPEKLFYYTVYKGLFAGSFEEPLVRAVIRQLNSKQSLLRDEYFQRVHATEGKNVEANVYIHLANFLAWGGHHLAERYDGLLGEGLKKFGSWTEIDILVNSDDLLFNGYTVADDSAGTFLTRFSHPPQAVKVPEIIPFDAAWMMHWGIADLRDFLRASHQREVITSVFSGYDKDFGIDLEKEFVSWVGHEVVLVGPPAGSGSGNPMVVLHTEDVVRAALALNEMETKVNRKNKTAPFLVTHNDYSIRKLGLNRLFRDLFGSSFPVFQECYFVTLKDYIIFSDRVKDLTRVIDQFYAHKTLAESVTYKALSDNISDRSNIYLYCNLREPDPRMNDVLQGAGISHLLDGLRHFEGFALQFSYINRMFYTNMFLNYNPEYSEISSTDWTAELDDDIIRQPFLVRNHRNGKTNILVFDRANNMYLLDQLGRRQWQLPLIEPPAGDFHMVDYYNNGKYQYLFNTVNYVYLVDLNGNYVADFPKKLVAPSTSPLSVLDYDGDGNKRLIIALSDNKIYDYDLHMDAVEGWTKISTASPVKAAVQHLRNGGKDFLLVTDEKGQVKITDRRGEDRIRPAGVNKAPHSVFYVNRTNSKGLFLSTNRQGKVVYVDEKGAVSMTDFGDFSPDHFFFYEDFNGDDHNDFIFVDRNRMIVYDRFKKVIMEQQLAEVVTREPVLFSWAGRKYLGIVLDAAGEIHVFDHQGRRFQDLYLSGNIPFVTGTLEEGHLSLITGKDRHVLNFQLN